MKKAAVEYIDDNQFLTQLTTAVMKLRAEGSLRNSRALMKTLRSGSPDIALAPPASKIMHQATLYESLKKKVLVHCSTCRCRARPNEHVIFSTTYAITTDTVVFNYHALEDNEHFHAVADSCGRVFPVKEILAVDKMNDIAIASVIGGDFSPFALSPDEPAGSPVVVMSHPSNQFYVMTRGAISRYCLCPNQFENRTCLEGKRMGMSVTADFANGSSGAPILNENGNVVGMVESTLPIYFCGGDDRQNHLQMVMKKCVPVRCILDLIEARASMTLPDH